MSDSAATYTPGVSEKRGTTSTFYHADIKNSVEQTSTSSQSVVASKQYDAFGNEVSSSGPWQGPFQYGGAFGYHTDSDYGLKHLGARYYDSTTGRFLSRDPIKDGRNWYVYCNGNPLTRIDANGLDPAPPSSSPSRLLVIRGRDGLGWQEPFIERREVQRIVYTYSISQTTYMDGPSKGEVIAALRSSDIIALYYIGHGAGGLWQINPEEMLAPQELKPAMGVRKMVLVQATTCDACVPLALSDLLDVAYTVRGYDYAVFVPWVFLGLTYPKTWGVGAPKYERPGEAVFGSGGSQYRTSWPAL